MDIFVDTGVVFGYSYNGDTFFPACRALFDEKEFRDNKYYTSKGIVKMEIDAITFSRTQGFKKIVRLLALRSSTILEKISDISMGNHPKYRELTDNIYSFLMSVRKDQKRKQHDSILLSNSHLWADNDSNLVTPHFLTTDKTDICDNCVQISQIVQTCLTRQCPLKIDYIPNFIRASSKAN